MCCVFIDVTHDILALINIFYVTRGMFTILCKFVALFILLRENRHEMANKGKVITWIFLFLIFFII